MKPHHQGFTLVEMAIVLVIIGLLLGGVLKGQEMVAQARIKNIANDLNGVSTAIWNYQDRFKKYPGDDNQAGARWKDKTTDGGGDGAIGLPGIKTQLNCAGSDKATENCLIWQHLRLSGFLGGDPGSTDAPQNSSGGSLQVQTGALGLNSLVICATALPGKIANAIDAQFDDGKPKSGQVRGTSATDDLSQLKADENAYVDDGTTTYVVCRAS